MIRNSGGRKLSLLMLLFGIAAWLLRNQLYTTAVDVKGLLVRNHPFGIALVALTGLVFVLVLLIVRKQDPGSCEVQCSGSFLGAFGDVAAGAGILATVLSGGVSMAGYLDMAWRWLGLAAPVCLFLSGVAKVFGKKPFFLLHVVVCLFFVLQIVAGYQLWSSNPQMQDYVFSLLGAMALMFFGFYTAGMEAECGNPRIRLGMGLAAVYLCMAELARSYSPALYLGGILWVLADLWGMGNAADSEEK